MKWHYSALEPDDRGINDTRAHVCELVAWRFLSHLSEGELIDYLLYELPSPGQQVDEPFGTFQDHPGGQKSNDFSRDESDELTGLLSARSPYHERHNTSHSQRFGANGSNSGGKDEDPTLPFVHLNALEIAAVADAKKFLSQRIVQKVVNGIWCGDIIFWDSLNAQTKKKAQKYNNRYASSTMPRYIQRHLFHKAELLRDSYTLLVPNLQALSSC